MTHTIYSSPLLRHVQRLVLERPASYRMIDLANDVGVSRVWLTAFKNGRARNARAEVVEALYVKLTGAQLISNDDQ